MAEASNRLDDFGLDAICDAISDGMMMTALAREIGVSLGALSNWIGADPVRSARVRACRESAAVVWDEKAEDVLTEAVDRDGIARARELAQHYRWRASKIAPRTYGDRLELAGEVGVRELPDDRIQSRLADLLRTAGASGALGGTGTQEGSASDPDVLPGDGSAQA